MILKMPKGIAANYIKSFPKEAFAQALKNKFKFYLEEGSPPYNKMKNH
jgi:hypothetical protein